MKVWIVTIGEPLPVDGPKARLYRSGMLFGELARDGHNVTWWTSRFNHHIKVHRKMRPGSLDLHPGQRIELLDGCAYLKNVSALRMLNHWQVAADFARRIRIKTGFDEVDQCADFALLPILFAERISQD